MNLRCCIIKLYFYSVTWSTKDLMKELPATIYISFLQCFKIQNLITLLLFLLAFCRYIEIFKSSQLEVRNALNMMNRMMGMNRMGGGMGGMGGPRPGPYDRGDRFGSGGMGGGGSGGNAYSNFRGGRGRGNIKGNF